jgi:hypothetical protein
VVPVPTGVVPVVEPLPELVLAAETGRLTAPGPVTEISDPPGVLLAPLTGVVLVAEPLPEPVPSTETGRLAEGRPTEISGGVPPGFPGAAAWVTGLARVTGLPGVSGVVSMVTGLRPAGVPGPVAQDRAGIAGVAGVAGVTVVDVATGAAGIGVAHRYYYRVVGPTRGRDLVRAGASHSADRQDRRGDKASGDRRQAREDTIHCTLLARTNRGLPDLTPSHGNGLEKTG